MHKPLPLLPGHKWSLRRYILIVIGFIFWFSCPPHPSRNIDTPCFASSSLSSLASWVSFSAKMEPQLPGAHRTKFIHCYLQDFLLCWGVYLLAAALKCGLLQYPLQYPPFLNSDALCVGLDFQEPRQFLGKCQATG